jgi:hypothetical protein
MVGFDVCGSKDGRGVGGESLRCTREWVVEEVVGKARPHQKEWEAGRRWQTRYFDLKKYTLETTYAGIPIGGERSVGSE